MEYFAWSSYFILWGREESTEEKTKKSLVFQYGRHPAAKGMTTHPKETNCEYAPGLYRIFLPDVVPVCH